MFNFSKNKEPKALSEKEQFTNELQNDLNNFYNSLAQKCAGKKGCEELVKKAKAELNEKLKSGIYRSHLEVSFKAMVGMDETFRDNEKTQLKEFMKFDMDSFEQEIEFLD